jgi:hypothetical protein
MVPRGRRRAGDGDGPPLGELVAPVPLLAVALLVVNDRVLKGSDLAPAWATGKISDFMGMLCFPLLLTAAFDTLLWALHLPGIDFSLRRSKLLVAVVATGAGFGAVKLWPPAAEAADAALAAIGFSRARIVPDATDLAALVMLPAAYVLGWREIRRVPRGRLSALARRYRGGGVVEIANGLADVADAAGAAGLARAWAAVLDGRGDDDAARATARRALAKLRRR